jgi:hypothetical protein
MRPEDRLGKLAPLDAERDAVHVAIIPVMAGESLFPGQEVGIEDGFARRRARPLIGIVDPFLKSRVRDGESCWVLLYPGTITSIRHDWTHPATPDGRLVVARPEDHPFGIALGDSHNQG